MKNKLFLVLSMFGASPLIVMGYANSSNTLPTSSILRQQKEVKGTVFDEINSPVAGATITVNGSTRGCITDLNGNFSISVEEGSELLVSFLGYETSVVKVTSEKSYNVYLQLKVDELEEVTVVAFAKQKKESVISSVSTIKPTELKVPSSNLTTALAGRMSGLIAYQTSGEPGKDNAQFFYSRCNHIRL